MRYDQHRPNLLRLQLLSETCPASGEVPGEFDVDIAQDEYGSPVYPWSRIKARCSESWAQLSNSACDISDETRELGGKIWGESGSTESTFLFKPDGGLLSLHPALLSMLERARDGRRALTSEESIALLTEERIQTSVDRERAAPEKETLRKARVLRSGLIFYGAIKWARDPSDKEIAIVALVLANTRHMGLNSNRGWGEVSLDLVADYNASLEDANRQTRGYFESCWRECT